MRRSTAGGLYDTHGAPRTGRLVAAARRLLGPLPEPNSLPDAKTIAHRHTHSLPQSEPNPGAARGVPAPGGD
ncbi:MAG: hypothetical protein ACRDGH_09495, partial [Candidatus Limnocylindria bacterium]